MKTLLLLLLFLSYTLSSTYEGSLPTKLKDSLLTLHAKAGTGGKLGVAVYSHKLNRFEVQINSNQSFIPASTLKTLVTGTAFHHLSPRYAPHTSIELQGFQKDSIFAGNISIKGFGDVNLSPRYFWGRQSAFSPLIDTLKHHHIRKLNLKFRDTTTSFLEKGHPKSWPYRHFYTWYGANIDAESYNDNCLKIRVRPGARNGLPVIVTTDPPLPYLQIRNEAVTTKRRANSISFQFSTDQNTLTIKGKLRAGHGAIEEEIPVPNPPAFLRAALIYELRKNFEVEVDAQTIARPLPFIDSTHHKVQYSSILGADTSQYLSKKIQTRITTANLVSWAEEINQRSQNFQAEMLLRILGKKVKGVGSTQAGTEVEKEFLHEMGLDTSQFKLADGSGLSHSNRVTPEGMAQYLHQYRFQKTFPLFFSTLTTPGLHGSRAARLWPMKNYLRIKTGFVGGALGLVGYVFANDEDTLTFALYLSDFTSTHIRGAALLDTLASKLARWYNPRRETLLVKQLLQEADSLKLSQFVPRLNFFSQRLMGVPYYLGLLGEGRFSDISAGPLYDLSRFDCVTYMEHVIALALSKDLLGFEQEILKVRYHSDSIQFKTRNHFFEADWLAHNQRFLNSLKLPEDSLLTRVMDKKFFYNLNKLVYPDSNPVWPLNVIPREKAIVLAENWPYEDRLMGVGFIGTIPWLYSTHTGFILAERGKPLTLRHASQLRGKTFEEPLADYLKARGEKIVGIHLFGFKDTYGNSPQ